MVLADSDESPWFAEIANYLASGVQPSGLNAYEKKNFYHNIHYYFLNDLMWFRACADDILRRCIPKVEVHSIIRHFDDLPCGGHAASSTTSTKILQCRFYWPTLFRHV